MDFYSRLEDSFPLSFLLDVTKKEYIPIVASCPGSCLRIVTTHDENRAKGPQRDKDRALSLKFGHPISGSNNFPHCLRSFFLGGGKHFNCLQTFFFSIYFYSLEANYFTSLRSFESVLCIV